VLERQDLTTAENRRACCGAPLAFSRSQNGSPRRFLLLSVFKDVTIEFFFGANQRLNATLESKSQIES